MEAPRRKLCGCDAALATVPGASKPNPTGESPPKASRSPRSKSSRLQDKRPVAALPLPTFPESSWLIVEGKGRASDEKQCNGQTEVDVNPKKVEMTVKVQPQSHPSGFCGDLADKWPSYESRSSDAQGYGKVQAESHPSGFGLDLADKWPKYESRSSDAQGYAIRGIPNLENTCYMNAVLQCLPVLDKLRERMLALDPKDLLPELLKELFVFVEASAAGDELDPMKVLTLRLCKVPFFKVGVMEDSHELLTALRDIWKEDEKVYNRQSDAPTVIDSIFGFEMLQILSCTKCGKPCRLTPSFLGLELDLASKWHPTKSAASPQTSEGPRSRNREIAVQLFPADAQRNLEKMQSVSESGYSRVIGSEVIVEITHKPLEVDSTQAQHISQRKDVVQSPLRIQEGKSVDSLTEDSISIEDFLLLFSEGEVQWCCPNCAKDHEEPSASQSKNGEHIVGSSNEDYVGDTDKTARFTTLPPVLTLHLNRTSHHKGSPMVDNTVGTKISGHVRFMEDLDVKRYMDPSSLDIGSTIYHLVGVVEHIGKESLEEEDGHYIAYVRARRLGNEQDGSSSSWFCADDCSIRQVTREQVLNCEAYILFYERMEDICGMQEMGEDIRCWEMIETDEIINPDSEDTCCVYKLKLEDIPWSTQIMYNKYNSYVADVFQNNKRYFERLQQGAEWLGKFSALVDHMLPLPLCSLAALTSSRISIAMEAAGVLGRAFKMLQSVTRPPEYITILFVTNEAQARHAVRMWEESMRSQWYYVVFDGQDHDQAHAVKEVMVRLGAGKIFFHPDFSDSE